VAQEIASTKLLPLLAALVLGACFNPEAMEPTEDAGDEDDGKSDDVDDEEEPVVDECLPTDDPCQAPADCCGYEGTAEVGDALCSGYGEDYRCTNVCQADSDCVEGCCIALNGITDHGACMSCEGLRFGSEQMLCLAGVQMLCGCLEGTDSACTEAERASFEAECVDPSTESGQLLVCVGGTASCAEASEVCSSGE
jgi:hypothetical protein